MSDGLSLGLRLCVPNLLFTTFKSREMYFDFWIGLHICTIDVTWQQVILWILQVILFEIDWAIFYANLHELSVHDWTNWVTSGKFMDIWWILCQVMADLKKVYDDLIIISLYVEPLFLIRKKKLRNIDFNNISERIQKIKPRNRNFWWNVSY